VGRTGTYIAVDLLIQEAKHTAAVDVFSCVSKLRKERAHMVQTQVRGGRGREWWFGRWGSSGGAKRLPIDLLLVLLLLTIILLEWFPQEQYAFVYRAVAESVREGDTSIPAAGFSQARARLLEDGSMEAQFSLLDKFSPRHPPPNTALSAENVHKNRDKKLVAGRWDYNGIPR
jgi:hypothetical protein